MIQETKSGINFNHKGFNAGIITDGDPFDRPDGSLERLINMDYDVETGEVINRNSTELSDIFDGLTIPDGYNIMKGGCKLFSFNDPVNRQVCLVCVQDTSNNVRMFVNTWYNPPSDQIYLNSTFGNVYRYENAIPVTVPQGWQDEWIELTGTEAIVDFAKTSPLSCTVSGSSLAHHQANYYRGWFFWNATKWNASDSDENRMRSFACIESYNGTNNFTIQDRDGDFSFTAMGWKTRDEIHLVRYPIMVYKGNSTATGSVDLRLNFVPTSKNWILKTDISLEILVGQEGNLWFGFLNKDITPINDADIDYANVMINTFKYYGWWMTYQQIPARVNEIGALGSTYADYRYGVRCNMAYQAYTDSRISQVACVLVLDFRQRICIFKAYEHGASDNLGILMSYTLSHGYDRRITGAFNYANDATASTEDPNGYEFNFSRPYFNSVANATRYQPLYATPRGYSSQFMTDPPTLNPVNNSLQNDIQYVATEAMFVASSIGVFAQGRLFLNNLEQADEIRYSLFQTEDVLPLQNKRNIDSTDKDKNVAIDLLGVNPVVFKNNSIHIAGIEGATEAGWRLLEVKGTVGCPYPNSIVRTPHGLMFANDSGVYLLSDAGEPTNIIRNRRLQEYLKLDKSNLIGTWYADHSEVWYYTGTDDEGRSVFWICKLNKEEKQIGWKEYRFGFDSGDWAIVDTINDEDNNLYIVTNKKLIRYKNDDELCTGIDADGNFYEIDLLHNYDMLSSSKDKFHWIEGSMRFELSDYAGRTQTLSVVIYCEDDTLLKVRNYDMIENGNLIFRNGLSNSQRAIKIGIAGTLTGQGVFHFQEANIRVKPLLKPIKSGFSKVG